LSPTPASPFLTAPLQYACENDATINGYLKGQGGFEGFIMTDWFAGHSTVVSVLSGLDMEMPAGLFFGDALVAAVQAGTVPESRVDDAITRVLTGLYAVGFMDDQPTVAQNLSAVATSDAHTDIARFLATQATVLLKNDGGLLPLDAGNLTQVAVLGDAAIYYGGGSGSVFPSYHITPYEAIFEALNDEMPTLRPASACSVTGNGSVATPYANNTFACMEGLPGAAACAQRCANISGCNGWSYIGGQRCNGWGWDINDVGACDIYAVPAPTSTPTAGAVSGVCTPAPVTPTPGARVNVSTYIGPDVRFAAQVASLADVAIVNVAITCSEGDDRPNLDLYSWQNDLVAAVVAANPRTIVVVRAPGAVTMPWLSSVPAVLYQGMPGQEAAHALSDAIFGVHNPSGKLPVSFPANETSTWLGVGTINPEQYPGTVRNNSWPEADYTEELSIGYRYYDQVGTPAPLFPFGFGLSYTTFTYSTLSVTGSLSSSGNVTVTLEVTNVGPRAGAEVVQLYVAHPEAAQEPPKVLAGFEKPYLQPGQSIRVKFTIAPRELQVWNAVTQSFELVAGTYEVLVGSSSVDIRLKGEFTATA
jgi:beta-glucosidase